MWVDPDFETMVEDSPLIAVVIVVEGGEFECKVQALDVLKGQAPDRPFKVSGYNNLNWPPDAIALESFVEGERVLMFLSPAWSPDEGKVDLKTVKLWYVPTPTTGDFRITAGKLHGGWRFMSYPHAAPGVDAEMVIGLIRGYCLHKAGKAPVEARKILAARLTVKTVKQARGNESKVAEVHWLLCAQGAYGRSAQAPAIKAAAESRDPLIKICAARAMRSLEPNDEALGVLSKLLVFKHPYVQAEAAMVLMSGKYTRRQAVPILVKALPSSDPRPGGPSNLMDPLRNVNASGREMMIRALTHFEAGEEAHDELIKLIRREGLNKGLFGALSEHFLKFDGYLLREKSRDSLEVVSQRLLWSDMEDRICRTELPKLFGALDDDDPLLVDTARKALERWPNSNNVIKPCVVALARERSEESLKLATETILESQIEILYRGKALQAFILALPRDHPAIRSLVLEALRKFKGQPDTEYVLAAACIPAACEEIRDMLNNVSDPSNKLLKVVRKAMALKLDPPKDSQARVNAYLTLLREGRPLYWPEPYILDELIAATPDDQRKDVADRLRAIFKGAYLSADYFRAVKALAGELTEEEKKTFELRVRMWP
jgi:hypothetical protein